MRKVRLIATQGADEANYSGATKPFFVDRNTGEVWVDAEAVGPLLEKGGFVLADPPVVELPTNLVRVRHASDPTAACAHCGVTYVPEPDGSFLVPAHAVQHLAAHGFVPVETTLAAPS